MNKEEKIGALHDCIKEQKEHIAVCKDLLKRKDLSEFQIDFTKRSLDETEFFVGVYERELMLLKSPTEMVSKEQLTAEIKKMIEPERKKSKYALEENMADLHMYTKGKVRGFYKVLNLLNQADAKIELDEVRTNDDRR